MTGINNLDVIDTASTEKTYTLKAFCTNCGWTGRIRIDMGYRPTWTEPCPTCGCRDIKRDHDWSA